MYPLLTSSITTPSRTRQTYAPLFPQILSHTIYQRAEHVIASSGSLPTDGDWSSQCFQRPVTWGANGHLRYLQLAEWPHFLRFALSYASGHAFLKKCFRLSFLLYWSYSHQDPSPATHPNPLNGNLISLAFSFFGESLLFPKSVVNNHFPEC